MEVPALHYHSHQLETCILYTSRWTLNELNLKSLYRKVQTDLFFQIFQLPYDLLSLKKQIFPQHQNNAQVLQAMPVPDEGKLG